MDNVEAQMYASESRDRSGSGLSESSSKWSNPSQVWVKLFANFVVFNIPVHTGMRSF
jgi:hypothetical protein